MSSRRSALPNAKQLAHFEALSKPELHQLAARLLRDDAEAIELCVAFIEADTLGHWHGRARAMMARRLKHCSLLPQQQARLSAAILARLVGGRFGEQFKDQLRLILYFDADAAFTVARGCLKHPKSYVRRYAAWILAHPQPPRRLRAAQD